MTDKVLVAHDALALREVMVRLLGQAGLSVTAVADGDAALAKLRAEQPRLVVLDVALSGVLAHELLETLRVEQPATRSILIASVYNRTSYKRRPTSLYGADDYVEQHHIPDLLVPKAFKLLDRPVPSTVAKVESALDHPSAGTIRDAAESRLHLTYRSHADGIERARRLARLIVADIALYNGDALRSTSRDELEARLRVDLEEGRVLFDARVPPEIRREADFIGDALGEWYATREAQ